MKSVVIAGGSQGLGLEIARNLDLENFKIFLLARNAKDLEEAKSLFEKASVSIFPVDLCIETEVLKTFKKIEKLTTSIDLLVNAAATWMDKTAIRNQSPQVFRRSFELNLMTAYNSIFNLLRVFPKSKPCIVNLGATASHRGAAEHSAFAMGKSSLRVLSESLAREESKNGLHVVHVTIDGLLLNDRTIDLNKELAEYRYIKMTSAAKTILSVFNQPKDCWTFELDIRPYNESF